MFNRIIKINYISIFLFVLLGMVSCNVNKDEDYAIIATEAQSIQRKLIDSKVSINKKNLEEIINLSSVDGIIRWEISDDLRFLIKSKAKHPLRAGSNKKRFWYIDNKFSILRIE